jgi:hypothetical protein
MAEIKSSLEIALERAARFGGGGKEDLAREEGKKRGLAAARRLLAGEETPQGLAARVEGQEGAARPAALAGAAGALVEALPGPEGPRALEGLRALAAGRPELARLEEAAAGAQAAERDLHRRLAAEQARALAQAGIKGPAVRPNPEAHPEYDARRQAAAGEADRQAARAAEELWRALAGEAG